MASSKKKKSSKKSVAKKKSKPAAKKKPAPKSASKPKAKAKAKAKAKPAKKAAPKKTKKAAAAPTHGDSWGNASLAPKVKSPKITNLEPSHTPPLALHDHEGGLVSPVAEEEELAERIHGGEEAVKDADEDTGSPVLDDRDDSDGEE